MEEVYTIRPTYEAYMQEQSTHTSRFVGKGLPLWKRYVTIVSLLCVVLLILWIALHEGASTVGSTILAILFVAGFSWYLQIIAPQPFSIEIDDTRILYRVRGSHDMILPWEQLTCIREEFFANRKRIGIVVYRRVTAAFPKAKVFALYRDDLPGLDELASVLQSLHPETCAWESTIVHD
jgi:hypothetical protein